ncbi:MAG: (2Fe-2S)-binding protein [Cyanobacteria bacterium]|nr:(2Fe-2S)-binding protein [Cyanobacteriota bacterium]
MTIHVRFLPDDVVAVAQPGELLLKVAERAGLSIPTGCLMGSCHACEVEIEGIGEVCSCISSVPDNMSEVMVHLFSDPNW